MRAGLSSLSTRQVPSCRRTLSAVLLSGREQQRTLACTRESRAEDWAAVPCEPFVPEAQGARSEICAGTLSPVMIIKVVVKNASAVNKRAVAGFPHGG